MSGTVTLYSRIGWSRTRVACGVMDKLTVAVWSGKTFTDRVIRSIHQTGRKIVTHHSPSAPISVVHDARSAAEEEENSGIRQKVEEHTALFVTLIQSNPENIMAAPQVVLKAIYETPVLVSTKAAGLSKVIPVKVKGDIWLSLCLVTSLITYKCLLSIVCSYHNRVNYC